MRVMAPRTILDAFTPVGLLAEIRRLVVGGDAGIEDWLPEQGGKFATVSPVAGRALALLNRAVPHLIAEKAGMAGAARVQEVFPL